MSTLRTNAIVDASGGTTATVNGYAPSLSNMAGRNRIINGDMTIDQRNAGAVVTAEGYLVDRWRWWRNQTYDVQRSTDAPTGFSNSLKATKTSTTQSTYAYFQHRIEGFNFSDLMFGTANAQSVTVSFWVKSSVTGTFSAGLSNDANNRTYPATYAISAANTWEYKTITIPGDTSGTWVGNTNGHAASVWFNFGASGSGTANTWNASDATSGVTGTANLGTTNGATFYITGVQLEAGSIATPFERRLYGDELALCQRYYQRFDYNSVAFERIVTGFIPGTSTSTLMDSAFQYSEKRALPSITLSAANTFRQNGAGASDNVATVITAGTIGRQTFNLQATGNSRTSGLAGWISRENLTTCFIAIDAEL